MKRYLIHAKVTKLLLRRIAKTVPVKVVLPNGEEVCEKRENVPTLEILNDNFFYRIGSNQKIGLGEAFMAGDWRPKPDDDLADVLTPFAEKLLNIVPGWMRKFRKLFEQFQPKHEENNLTGSKSNISRHYDLSNDLFKLFLDETLTYSSANFAGARPGFEGLAEAQRRKIDGILDFAGVKSGMKVLEIGTGWGQLSIQAAKRGAHVHTITLSKEQAELAQQRVNAGGLSDLVQIELRDYRDLQIGRAHV